MEDLNEPKEATSFVHYLNEENLKHLQRISKCVKLDFNAFISQMLVDEQPPHVKLDLFKKKNQNLNIETLQTRTEHI
jgi:hypothetical protein